MRQRLIAEILLAGALGAIGSLPAAAATYVAMRDDELVARTPIIVLAEVSEQSAELSGFEGWTLPFTRTRLHPIEVFKGSLGDDLFEILLPGGTVGESSWSVPGMPRFVPGSRVLLFLAPAGGGRYVLTELALSKFDVLADETGRRFAVRPSLYFGAETVIARGGAAPPQERARELDAFLSALRAAGRGEAFAPAPSAGPSGTLHLENRVLRSSDWVNVGGQELGADCASETCLLRWFWDGAQSPVATVSVIGAQTNLTDGTDGLAHIAAAIESWRSVGGTDLRIQPTSSGGNVVVHLDANDTPFGAWSGPQDCGAPGILGVAVPIPMGNPQSWRGDRYVPIGGAQVYVRRVACPNAYEASWFRSLAVHEIGHALGLGHSTGQTQSAHSQSGSGDLDAAVMRQYLSLPTPPDSPQGDDAAGLRHLYPGAAPPPPPAPTSAPNCGPGTDRVCPPDQSPKVVPARG